MDILKARLNRAFYEGLLNLASLTLRDSSNRMRALKSSHLMILQRVIRLLHTIIVPPITPQFHPFLRIILRTPQRSTAIDTTSTTHDLCLRNFHQRTIWHGDVGTPIDNRVEGLGSPFPW